MSKRIAAAVIVLLAVSVSASAREGFGFTKKAAEMSVMTPPAVNVAGSRVSVKVTGDRDQLGSNLELLQRSITDLIEASGTPLHVASPPDVYVAVDIDRLDVDHRRES